MLDVTLKSQALAPPGICETRYSVVKTQELPTQVSGRLLVQAWCEEKSVGGTLEGGRGSAGQHHRQGERRAVGKMANSVPKFSRGRAKRKVN
jgi:hypothetical protein